MRHQSTTPTATHAHYEPCEYCSGTGETPTGHINHWGPVHGACIHCMGEGMVPVDYGCDHCLDTRVNVCDVEFDPKNPQPCRYCQPVATTAA